VWRVRSAVDPAAGLSARADYFVKATVAQWTSDETDPNHGKIYLLDIYRARLPLIEQAKYLEHHYRVWRPYGLPYVLMEKLFTQTALFQYLTVRGLCPLRPCGPTYGARSSARVTKEDRAGALASMYEQGRIVHPLHAPWLRDYEQEILEFPRGEHDDMVDAVTYAVDDVILGRYFQQTKPFYDEFTYDADMRPKEDVSGLYEQMGVTA
jgi:predicted phage terminase large subunit-like protein